MDAIATYAASKGWVLQRRIVLVEGTSDEKLFALTNRLAGDVGVELLGNDISIIAAGDRDRGGTFGVGRELIALRALAPYILDPAGGPLYRVIGLLDDDYGGRTMIEDIAKVDRSVLEFRDIFRIRPAMPLHTTADPVRIKQESNLQNLPFSGLDWEIEDLLSAPLRARFEQTHLGAVVRRVTRGGQTHLELTRNGKRDLHRFVREEATLYDLLRVVEVVRVLRSIFGLPDVQLP